MAKEPHPLQGLSDFFKALLGLVLLSILGILICAGVFHHWWYFPVGVAALVGFAAFAKISKT